MALAGLAMVAFASTAWPPPSRITRQNLDRLKKGMSKGDVEAILGPPGDYGTAPLVDPDPLGLIMSTWRPYYVPLIDHYDDGREIIQWRGDAGIICVAYSQSGHVSSAGWWPVKREEQTPIDNLLWRAKRQWHRWFPE